MLVSPTPSEAEETNSLSGLKLKQSYSRKCFQNTSGEKMKIRNVTRLTVIAVIAVAIMFAGCIEEKSQDSDGDGWTDDQEKLMQTDPHKIDTDGDRIKDSEDPTRLLHIQLLYRLVMQKQVENLALVVKWVIFR